MTEPILSLRDIHTHIQQHHILQGVSLDVNPGRATVLLGRNGAGKSTTLRTIMGLNPATSGTITLAGQAIQDRKPFEIARLGIGFVPEDFAVIYSLTVEENFRLAMFKESEEARQRMAGIFDLFPDLKKFLHSKAGVLSGGQKQMLAIALALVLEHQIVLIDEPSKGLAPVVVEHLGESLNQIKDDDHYRFGGTKFLSGQQGRAGLLYPRRRPRGSPGTHGGPDEGPGIETKIFGYSLTGGMRWRQRRYRQV